MNKDFFTALSWRKSLRIKMFGSFLLSFTLAVLLTNPIDVLIPGTLGKTISFSLLWVLFLLFFFLFNRQTVRYLRTLADGLMAIAHGRLDYRVPPTRRDELGSVAQNINYMAERLQNMMIKERQLEKSKMELITSVSHDLRTPLTSIIGYLNLLQHDDYADLDEHKRYIRNAYNKTQQLKKLIDDLFEYTRLSGGAERLSLQTIDLNGLLEQIMGEFEPIALEQGLTVRHIRMANGPVYGKVDVEKWVRAVDNLLMNALKFSLRPGDITVCLFQRDEKIVLSVENEGEPVTREQEPLLFERFYKVDPSRSGHSAAPGAGLGLSIARNIVELHGGRIGLHHEHGHFTFYIELPQEEQPAG